MFQQVYVPPGLCTNRSRFPQVYVPPGLDSPRSMFPQVYVPTGLCSIRSMFPQVYVTVLTPNSNLVCHFHQSSEPCLNEERARHVIFKYTTFTTNIFSCPFLSIGTRMSLFDGPHVTLHVPSVSSLHGPLYPLCVTPSRPSVPPSYPSPPPLSPHLRVGSGDAVNERLVALYCLLHLHHLLPPLIPPHTPCAPSYPSPPAPVTSPPRRLR